MLITSLRYIESNFTNTYACKNAMANSKPMTKKTIKIGKPIQIQWIKPELATAHIKLIKIFSKIWPDIIFVNSLIAKLKILEIYETYSIKINKGTIGTGTPSGKNKIKYFSRWKHIPIKLLPIKNAKEKYRVRIKWLVIVMLYGIIPKILLIKINKNVE